MEMFTFIKRDWLRKGLNKFKVLNMMKLFALRNAKIYLDSSSYCRI